MKRTEKVILGIMAWALTVFIIVTSTGCVAKHPKCAAYDKIEHDPLVKTNLDRSLYK